MSENEISDGDEISIDSSDFSDSDESISELNDEDLVPDLLEIKPKKENPLEKVIIVDGCPIVGQQKLEKLCTVIRKNFSKFGSIVRDHFPMKNDSSSGYCFIQFNSAGAAQEAIRQMNGKALDKAHTFQVTSMATYERDTSVNKEYVPPTPQKYVDHGNLRYWLQDDQFRDQMVVIHNAGETTTVLFYGPNNEYQIIEGAQRNRWTESLLSWSSTGILLATFHSRGIALWGGEKFSRIRRFEHPGVSLVSFSPCDRYMVTFSPHADTKEDPQAIIVWNILTGEKGRGFHSQTTASWPVFRWSHTGQYFARLQPDLISVYETPGYGLLDKKSIKIPGVSEFVWSPTENIIAYWVCENENTPARVTLMELPSRRELCSKNIYSVSDIKMEWQKQGDFLCVLVTRYAKKKMDKDVPKYSGLYYNLEIFRLREKHIPVDNIEVKSLVSCFALEPFGSKFAFVCAETTTMTNVKFYDVHTGGSVEHIKTLERMANRRVEELFWSPKGGILVMKNNEGSLEFVDTSDMTVMSTAQHPGCNGLEWDPSGRYVCTWLSIAVSKQDCNVWVWSSTGRLLTKLANIDLVCRTAWRPRPACLLSDAKIKEVKRNMRRYTAQFEMHDRMRSTHANKALVDRRIQLHKDYQEWRTHLLAKFDKEKEERENIRGKVNELDEEITEDEITFLIDVSVTKVDNFE